LQTDRHFQNNHADNNNNNNNIEFSQTASQQLTGVRLLGTTIERAI
jgi:hypothetical protein